MFLVYLVGVGDGCDYTIGCNHALAKLPDSIDTMERAIEFVTNNSEDPKFGSLNYHHIEIESATIYEVVNKTEVDVRGFYHQKQEAKKAEANKEQDIKDQIEFDRLKQKFGK